MKIVFKKPYGPYRREEEIEIKGDLADRLIAWGYAVPARQQQGVIETATAEVQAERADLTPRRRRR
jgi:hypothetical protein